MSKPYDRLTPAAVDREVGRVIAKAEAELDRLAEAARNTTAEIVWRHGGTPKEIADAVARQSKVLAEDRERILAEIRREATTFLLEAARRAAPSERTVEEWERDVGLRA